MRVDDFDFELPPERIALRPIQPRDAARLLVVDPCEDVLFHDCTMLDLPKLLRPGDALVFNDTKVIPARLIGRRVGRGETTPKIELTLHKRQGGNQWWGFVRPARKLEVGDRLLFGSEDETCFMGRLVGEVTEKGQGGEVFITFDFTGPAFDESLALVGTMPLPPYIASKRAPDEQDVHDYQTLFAEKSGAVAAPTAGLHFTERLLKAISERGVSRHHVTLHVGAGTFLPVKVEETADHKMHAEWGEISKAVADRLNAVKKGGGRLIAVGTTSLRLLESAANNEGQILPFSGETDIFITPGYTFKVVEGLLTNFHLPRSTLFMLVSAFSGLNVMKEAYAHAIEKEYRFYSYGDACFLNKRLQ